MNAVSSKNAAPVSRPEGKLRVGGLTPLSATDYPDQLAAVVFCQGCPWRCGYCHNPHLLPRRGAHEIAWADVLAFLERRRGLLDAVVFSGGEPTLQAGLAVAMREVKALGFRIGLHTAGMAPPRLAAVLPLVDWVGMDIKAPFEEYARVTGAADGGHRVRESMELILGSDVVHEFRTTVHPSLLPAPALERLADVLASEGVHRYALQEFRPQGAGCAPASASSYLDEAFCRKLSRRFEFFSVRRA